MFSSTLGIHTVLHVHVLARERLVAILFVRGRKDSRYWLQAMLVAFPQIFQLQSRLATPFARFEVLIVRPLAPTRRAVLRGRRHGARRAILLADSQIER